MKRKPHAGSAANRSGDRHIISASLTGRNCPCPRRFHGAHLPVSTAATNPECGPRLPACSRKIPEFSAVVPAFSPGIPGHSHVVPARSPAVPASSPVVQRVPRKSQPFSPSCRLFPGNPGVFHRNPAPFPRNPQGSRRFPRRFTSTIYQFKGRNSRSSGTGFQPVTDGERPGKTFQCATALLTGRMAVPLTNPDK